MSAAATTFWGSKSTSPEARSSLATCMVAAATDGPATTLMRRTDGDVYYSEYSPYEGSS